MVLRSKVMVGKVMGVGESTGVGVRVDVGVLVGMDEVGATDGEGVTVSGAVEMGTGEEKTNCGRAVGVADNTGAAQARVRIRIMDSMIEM